MEYFNDTLDPNPTLYPLGTYPWMRVLAGGVGSRINGLKMDGDLDLNGHQVVNANIPISASLGDLDNVDQAADASKPDGYILSWATDKWVATSPAVAGVTTLGTLTDVNFATSPATGQSLVFDGTNWSNVAIVVPQNVEDLANVAVSNPSNGELMTYQGGSWVNAAAPVIPSSLGTLTDVNFSTSPANGQSLVFDGTNWSNSVIAVPQNIQDLVNVTVSNPANGELMTYINGNWLNIPASVPVRSIGSLSNVSNAVDSANSREILMSDGTNWGSVVLNSISLEELKNFGVLNSQNGEMLYYDSGSMAWINGAPPQIPSSVRDLVDVSATQGTSGQILRFNSTGEFMNQ